MYIYKLDNKEVRRVVTLGLKREMKENEMRTARIRDGRTPKHDNERIDDNDDVQRVDWKQGGTLAG
jgi:hypothetical protein